MKQIKTIGEVLNQTFAPKTIAPSEMHPVHQVYDGIISTYTGKKINLNEPLPESIDIEDIATGLSNICRFGGQVRLFYSVAQHSVLVCALVPDHLKQCALLHDAAEAYIGGVVKPFKVMIESAYEPFESRFNLAIFLKFRINPLQLLEIKKADKYATSLEHEFLRKNNKQPLIDVLREKNLVVNKEFAWTQETAYATFKTFFKSYFC